MEPALTEEVAQRAIRNRHLVDNPSFAKGASMRRFAKSRWGERVSSAPLSAKSAYRAIGVDI